MGKPIYGYWKVRGLANPTRHLLHYAGVDFEEKHYEIDASNPNFLTDNEWTKEKPSMGFEFPNLPYWIEKETGVKLTESKAILKHIAREYAPELMPKTNAEHRDADMLENLVVDIQTRLIYMAYWYTDEASAQVEQAAKDKFGYLSKYLSGKKWIMGQKLSYVDFIFYDVLYFFKSYDSSILDAFPALISYMKTFESIPAIAKYMASPNYIKGPCVSEFATKKF